VVDIIKTEVVGTKVNVTYSIGEIDYTDEFSGELSVSEVKTALLYKEMMINKTIQLAADLLNTPKISSLAAGTIIVARTILSETSLIKTDL